MSKPSRLDKSLDPLYSNLDLVYIVVPFAIYLIKKIIKKIKDIR